MKKINLSQLSKRTKVLAIAGVIAVVGLGSSASLSYFTDSEKKVNDFTTGGLDIQETETDWDNTEDGKNVYPGYITYKNPTIQNITGTVDNDIWVKATVKFTNYDGTAITDKERNNLIYETVRWDETHGTLKAGSKYSYGTILSFKNVNPAFEFVNADTAPTTGEYVYYLKNPLKSADTKEAGESVTLFNTIVFPTEWSQTELDILGDYQITVEFEAIQKSTFEDVYDAMSALGDENVHVDYDRPENAGNKISVNTISTTSTEAEITEVPLASGVTVTPTPTAAVTE